jgi:hypothetical protein
VSAAASVRTALALLQAASADWRHKGPSDGSEPLCWPLAVAAARAHLTHALTALEAPGAAHEIPAPNTDAEEGMLWWNGCEPAERLKWLQRADSACPADAWAAYSAAKEVADQTRA